MYQGSEEDKCLTEGRTIMDQTTIAQLKIDLYRALLLKKVGGLSTTEADIGYYLSKDADIQELLNKCLDTH